MYGLLAETKWHSERNLGSRQPRLPGPFAVVKWRKMDSGVDKMMAFLSSRRLFLANPQPGPCCERCVRRHLSPIPLSALFMLFRPSLHCANSWTSGLRLSGIYSGSAVHVGKESIIQAGSLDGWRWQC